MPEPQTPPTDGPQGAEGNAPSPAAAEPPKPEKTFTQQELDDIVKARVARAVPDDYETLKARAAAADAADDEKKTELQKAQDAAKKSAASAEKAIATANTRLLKAALLAEASQAGVHDPDLVVMALAANPDVTVDKDGNVVGAKEAVKQLLDEKPYLVKGKTPGASGGEFGGNDKATIDEQIRELEKKGDRQSLTEARRLKITNGLSVGT